VEVYKVIKRLICQAYRDKMIFGLKFVESNFLAFVCTDLKIISIWLFLKSNVLGLALLNYYSILRSYTLRKLGGNSVSD